jgi:lactobin A/cerein 7B family class IIb bacteriocin
MQNLTSCGVVELNETEMQDIEGGWIVIAIRVAIVAAALLYPTPAN